MAEVWMRYAIAAEVCPPAELRICGRPEGLVQPALWRAQALSSPVANETNVTVLAATGVWPNATTLYGLAGAAKLSVLCAASMIHVLAELVGRNTVIASVSGTPPCELV